MEQKVESSRLGRTLGWWGGDEKQRIADLERKIAGKTK
jgi:hypothetical protein